MCNGCSNSDIFLHFLSPIFKTPPLKLYFFASPICKIGKSSVVVSVVWVDYESLPAVAKHAGALFYGFSQKFILRIGSC